MGRAPGGRAAARLRCASVGAPTKRTTAEAAMMGPLWRAQKRRVVAHGQEETARVRVRMKRGATQLSAHGRRARRLQPK